MVVEKRRYMDQEAFIDEVQEEVLNRLPYEAIEKLANLSDEDTRDDEKISTILAEYGINAEDVAREVAKKEGLDG